MNQIKKEPEKYIFPNFCFTKKYTEYFFINSSIISTTEEAHNYFFKILKSLENCLGKIEKNTWQFLIPFDCQAKYRDEKGNWGTWDINKELKEYTLEQLQNYFLSFFNGYLRSHFILLADLFWINISDKICVYASFNQEIIVIGSDVDCDFGNIKKKDFLFTRINPLQNNEMRFVDGQLQYTSEKKIGKVDHFFYKSFDEYIDHWGPVFRWSSQQINYLKEQFN